MVMVAILYTENIQPLVTIQSLAVSSTRYTIDNIIQYNILIHIKLQICVRRSAEWTERLGRIL